MLSVLVWPKVITLSVFHCISNHIVFSVLNEKNRILGPIHIFTVFEHPVGGEWGTLSFWQIF
jgi:hypothetical protein